MKIEPDAVLDKSGPGPLEVRIAEKHSFGCALPDGTKFYIIPEGWKLLKDTTGKERDWVEDFSDENGNYYNTCGHCLRQFVGHKRRSVCHSCAMIDAAQGEKG